VSITKRFREGNSRTTITDPNDTPGDRRNRGAQRGRILHEAVVNNFFANPIIDLEKNPPNDPDVTFRDSMASGANLVTNPSLITKMPRCAITATVVSDREAWGETRPEIFYPLFSHITLPVKPGEKIWVIYDRIAKTKARRGYWITRISSNIDVDDPNYTHLDREYLYNQVPVSATSAMEASTGESQFDASDVYNFLGGGAGSRDKNTMPGDDPYGAIVSTSPSYIEQFNGEPVPRFSPRVGDLALAGSNNTLIVLGQDRGSLTGPDDDSGEKGIGTIDIVVGRGQAEDTAPAGEPVELEKRGEDLEPYSETNKFPQFDGIDPNAAEGNPDFVTDLSRAYVSMKTDGDVNFGIDEIDSIGADGYTTDTADSGSGPYVVVKSTNPRIIAREDGSIKIVHEGGSSIVMDSDGNIQIKGTSISVGSASADQPYIRYDEFKILQDEIIGEIKALAHNQDVILNQLQGFLTDLTMALGFSAIQEALPTPLLLSATQMLAASVQQGVFSVSLASSIAELSTLIAATSGVGEVPRAPSITESNTDNRMFGMVPDVRSSIIAGE